MDLLSLIFYFFIIVPSSILHEYAHGWMADRLGDPTARYAGRLTLDPRTHIDVWGTLLLPLLLFFGTNGSFLFAYAKPVPYDPNNLSNRKWGPAMVGLAGPAANLLLACAFALVVRLMPLSEMTQFVAIIVYANLMLMVFNLLPIPPLDGSKLLYALFPNVATTMQNFFERYGILLVLFVAYFLFRFISPVITILFNLLVGAPVGW